MEQIRDMLYVKGLERRLNRRLTEEEMDGEPFLVRTRSGNYEQYRVPILRYPWDLMIYPQAVFEAMIESPKNKLTMMNNGHVSEWAPVRSRIENKSIYDGWNADESGEE